MLTKIRSLIFLVFEFYATNSTRMCSYTFTDTLHVSLVTNIVLCDFYESSKVATYNTTNFFNFHRNYSIYANSNIAKVKYFFIYVLLIVSCSYLSISFIQQRKILRSSGVFTPPRWGKCTTRTNKKKIEKKHEVD